MCPKCGKNWTGEKFDGGWVRQFQDWLAKGLIEAGLVFRVSGGERYAAFVRKNLLHYADHYQDYPLESNLLGPTRLFQSTYLESFWLTDLVTAYDLVRAAPCFSGEDHAAIRELFYASSGIIKSYDEKRSNRQAFNNVALGAVGLLYEDAELVDYALAGPHGFTFHMRESLLEDGLWYEGENYHFATLHHLLDLAEMARHREIDLYEGRSGYGSLKAMFYGPLDVIYPDLTFPARKDGWFGRGIAYYKEVYELGYARYGDERLGGLLAAAYAEAERAALSPRGFLNMVPELPQRSIESLRPRACQAMPGTGVAVLRSDDGATYASLEYGHYGGGHGHPDRLHLSFYAGSHPWFTDPGTGWYHVPELGWYRSTLAHNTVTADGLSQEPSEGRLIAFGAAAGFEVAQAANDGAYPGVKMRRTLCLGKGYLLDVFDLHSSEAHRYDWVLHARAPWQTPGVPAPTGTAGEALGDGDGYEFLADVARLGSDKLHAELRDGPHGLRVLQLGSSELYHAKAPGIALQEQPFHALIARRRAKSTRYVTCFLFGENAGRARLEEQEPGLYTLHLGGETHHIALDDAPGVAVCVERAGELQTFAWFEKQDAALPGLSLHATRSLSNAALRKEGAAWRAELPEEFGRVRLRFPGLQNAKAGVAGLPEGAHASASGGDLLLTQAPGVSIWLDGDENECLLFAGCENQIRFHTASYGEATPEIAPALQLPGGWQLFDLRSENSGDSTAWTAVLKVPARFGPSSGTLALDIAGKRRHFECRIEAPLRSSWSLRSVGGRAYILLHLDELRGCPARVSGRLTAPWLLDAPRPFEANLEPYAKGTIAQPLPDTPLAPPSGARADDEVVPADAWILSGTDNSGPYTVQATLELQDFRGQSNARFPIYWAAPATGRTELPAIALNRPEQAYWAETPWQSEVDASLRATLRWSARGLHLRCRVTDDRHVHDANPDDLYENDSLQLYLDARAKHHQDPHFTPGVAAYTLAPGADRRNLQISVIAGNREISNRGARAGWLTAEGIEASVAPLADGYELEAFLPYESLGFAPLEVGDVAGLDLALSDNDGTWYRKQQLVWSGARGRRCYIRGSYHDPREYGYLIVSPGEEQEGAA